MKKYLLIIFLLLGCNKEEKISKNTELTGKGISIDALNVKLKEVCINGVVYYAGWSGMSNGGAVLTPKYVRNRFGTEAWVEVCDY